MPAQNVPEPPVVATTAGPVRGAWRGSPGDDDASAAFLGIPFAQAPTGALRFLAPVPPEPWSVVRDATAYGPTAQRGDQGETLIPEPSIPGDSTLNVNVFTPSPEPAAPGLPVMVWIHGGGFVSGSPASPWYDGRTFNRDGVVTVSLSYRLGFDGFGLLDDAPSNRGIRDLLAALEWVQANISAFGGDPARVTIAGQSAGGGAVLTLLGMPAAQHLFHGAISISGALADVPADLAAERTAFLADALGVPATLDGLRSAPEDAILDAQRRAGLLGARGLSAVTEMLQGLPWGPVIDGDLITQPTPASLRDGVGADIPLLLGAADDELTGAMDAYRSVLRFVPAGLALSRMLPERERRRTYRAATAGQRHRGTAAALGRFATDTVFRAVVPRIAEARRGRSTWAYRFAWPSPVKGWACHCLDVPFWFDVLQDPHVPPIAGAHPPQGLADAMHAAAVRFVTQGEPGWAAWQTDPGMTRVFGDAPGTPAFSARAFDDALSLV